MGQYQQNSIEYILWDICVNTNTLIMKAEKKLIDIWGRNKFNQFCFVSLFLGYLRVQFYFCLQIQTKDQIYCPCIIPSVVLLINKSLKLVQYFFCQHLKKAPRRGNFSVVRTDFGKLMVIWIFLVIWDFVFVTV